MNTNQVIEFPKDVQEKIGYYVYRLIDPRNGETFYVGKGKDNRVFTHANSPNIDYESEDREYDEKIERIIEIQNAGFNVEHVIHRHGMDEKTAYEVEGALIGAYSGLSNIRDGRGNDEYGVMHAKEIINNYQAEKADFSGYKVLMICVNKSAMERSLYEAVRYCWKLNKSKAENAKYVLAIIQGCIRGVFVANKWMEAKQKNFPGRQDECGRYGFEGEKAPEDIQNKFLGKMVPDEYRKKGASNPIKYSWK